MTRKNVNYLMKKYVLGTASKAETSELFSRADIQDINNLLNCDDFVERYEMYNRVDNDKAFHDMMERIGKENNSDIADNHEKSHGMHFIRSRWMRYAAMAIVVLGTAGIVWWHSAKENKVIAALPENAVKITTEMHDIMERAKEVGKTEATVSLIGKAEQEQIADECGLSTEELLEAHKITTVQDREFWVRLCDGTLVHINGGTRMIYPEHFYGLTRDIYIEGEAYFMVSEDKEHPFIVHTPCGNVKELGTEFNVCTRKIVEGQNVEQTEVVLVKGSIAVSISGNEQEHEMKPGDMAVMTHDGKIGLGKVDVAPYVAWNTGTFSFKDKPLGDVMEILSKWYDVDIDFENEKMRNTLITGTFDRYESVENILSGIGKSIGTDIRLKGNTVIISNH